MDIKLKDICVGGGKYGIPASAVPYDKRKYRYLRISDISDDGFLLDDDKKSLNDEDAAQYLLTSDDIVFARTGNSTGRAFFYEQRYGDLVYAGFLIKFHLDSSKINPRFVKYYTISKLYKHWIKCYQDGSTRGNMSAQSFLNLPIPSICRKKQDSLVKILDSITEKMELNQKINLKLENIARTLYNYWFIQFDFPDEFGRPYKSSGGKMVYNEVLKREIPADWEVKLVRDLFSTYLGGTPSRNISRYWNNGDISWLSSGEIANFPIVTSAERITQEGLENSATYLLPKNTLMISITGNIRVSISAITACTNQSVVGIKRNSDFSNSYLYFYFRNYIPQFETLMTGAVQKHINKDIIDTTPFLLPKKSILSSYQEQIDPIIDQIIDNALENNTLLRLRDFLLPMLMNGQVSVKS